MARGGGARLTNAVTSQRRLESCTTTVLLLLAAGTVLTVAGASCPAGFVPSASVSSLRCSGTCPCNPSDNLTTTTISSNSEGSLVYGENADCVWIIHGLSPQVTFGSYLIVYPDVLSVSECFDAECSFAADLTAFSNGPSDKSGLSFSPSETMIPYLRIRLTSTAHMGFPSGVWRGFTATVSGGGTACEPCAGYTPINASGCIPCPENTSPNAAGTGCAPDQCGWGYTGDPGLGEGCVACEADTYKNEYGPAPCTACPPNQVMVQDQVPVGGIGFGRCYCPAGHRLDYKKVVTTPCARFREEVNGSVRRVVRASLHEVGSRRLTVSKP